MAGGGEERSWVPVRVVILTDLLLELDTILLQRRCEYQCERGWEKEAAAAPPDLTAAQRLDLVHRFSEVTSLSWYAFACMLCRFEEGLDDAVDPDIRPRPESASWWYWCYRYGQRFVHVSPGQLVRARELRADAYARTQRIRELVEDLRKRYRGATAAAAAEHSIPGLIQGLQRVQWLTDAVVLRLQELRGLVDRMIASRDDTRAATTRVGRRRGRSAPPPLQDGAMHTMLRLSASMQDVAASS